MQRERGFGERLRYIRNEKGISIEKLAEDTGISASLLQAIERGEKKPRFSYPAIKSIADTLGISIDDLVDIKFE